MSAQPVADRRQRIRNSLEVVLVIGLIPLGIFAAIARAWVLPTAVVVAFAAAGSWAVAWLGSGRVVPPPDSGGDASYTPPAAHHERIGRVRRSLVQSTKEAASFDRNVRPILTRLADDRLRATYGITMTTHPDAARARLGEELWQRLASTSTQPLSEAELRRLVTTLDHLSPRS
ncbi:MAG: hypothetical protein JWM93_39 [Frankiales bacterium]|nr:hypothetical protein [Frankiales bacterium]